MEEYMKANFIIDKQTDTVNSHGWMGNFMKVHGKMIKLMDRENLSIQMDKYI